MVGALLVIASNRPDCLSALAIRAGLPAPPSSPWKWKWSRTLLDGNSLILYSPSRSRRVNQWSIGNTLGTFDLHIGGVLQSAGQWSPPRPASMTAVYSLFFFSLVYVAKPHIAQWHWRLWCLFSASAALPVPLLTSGKSDHRRFSVFPRLSKVCTLK